MTTMNDAERAGFEAVYGTIKPEDRATDDDQAIYELERIAFQAGAAWQRAQSAANDSHDFKNFHRLLCERFGYTHDEKDWRRDQLSLIEWIAKQSAGVPEGWKLVPVEPTEEMMDAASKCYGNDDDCYRDMLAAAPATPDAQVAVPNPLRYTNDGELAECPCCGSVDVGGAHDTVNCYGCGLQITKPRPLQNAVDAWNRRAQFAVVVPDEKPLPDLMMSSYHEAIGWNAYRKALLAAAPTVKAEQVQCELHGDDSSACEKYSGNVPCEPAPANPAERQEQGVQQIDGDMKLPGGPAIGFGIAAPFDPRLVNMMTAAASTGKEVKHDA